MPASMVEPKGGRPLLRLFFLASPRASYITGATVAADGGRRAI